jgi:glycosyltransferase involved in cell wall biosynthesis
MENSITCGGKPLRIAVFYSSEAVLGADSSGGGNYENSLSQLLLPLRDEYGVEIINFVRSGALNLLRRNATLHGDPVHRYRRTPAERLLHRIPNASLGSILAKMGLLRIRRVLRRKGVHLAYFASPNPVAMALEDIPYVATVWDLGHRDLPGFPEVWAQSEWSHRERLYSTVVPRASFVMVDSPTTGAKLERFYGLKSDRWQAIGLLPYVRAPESPLREISGSYIIYPAMKWPHKNHVTLLAAFALVLKKRPEMTLVLTGADGGNSEWIKQKIRSLGIQSSVIDLGFITKQRLSHLVFHAKVLVMPSLLGPTNLPPLEALALGTPAIVSSAHDFGLGEIDGLTKVSSLDVEGWANAIEGTLIKDSSPAPRQVSSQGALETHVEVFSQLARERENWQTD